MSIDKSLVSRNKLKRQRNVLTRAERIEKLIEDERWEEGRSIFGLPKVRTIVAKRKKAAAQAEEEAPAIEGEGGGAAPAASAEEKTAKG